jgi:TetR/AcrR family transcriptional repressor of bet genes
MADGEPKYRRVRPALRREHLIASTLAALAEHGASGASVRRIAANAAVSVGLINHHYAHLEDLVAEAYESLATSILRQILEGVEKVGSAPRARVSAFIAVSFSSAVLDPRHLSAWLVFWSMIRHSDAMKAVRVRTNENYRRELATRLSALAASSRDGAAIDVRLATIGLCAMMDGLWLDWCLDARDFNPAEGVEICEAWIEERWPRALVPKRRRIKPFGT